MMAPVEAAPVERVEAAPVKAGLSCGCLILSLLVVVFALLISAQYCASPSSNPANVQDIVVWTVTSPILDPQKNNITVRLAAPSAKGTYPLVIFQHGTGTFNIWYSTILNYVASKGYIVIAPQMYTFVLPNGLNFADDSASAEIERAARVFKWLTSSSSPVALPPAVEMNLSSVAFTGHSRGGKVAAGLAEDVLQTKVALQAFVGLDPVDGSLLSSDPSNPSTSFCDTPHSIEINAPALLVGSGLGAKSIIPWCPRLACAPPSLNYSKYFNCFKNQTYQMVATDFGHMDLLDDDRPGCNIAHLNCNCLNWAGSLICVGGGESINRGDLRSFLGQLLVAFFNSTLKGEPEAFDHLIKNPSTAPIAVKDVSVYPPSRQVDQGVNMEAQ